MHLTARLRNSHWPLTAVATLNALQYEQQRMLHTLAKCVFSLASLVCCLPVQVLLSAVLWGCGTAVGEVPPYFLSFKAASAGRRNVMYESVQSSFAPARSGWLQDDCLYLWQ